METSFDLMLWRAILLDAAAIPSGDDLREWAERLGRAAELDASALLTDVAVLHQGFSPQAIAGRERASPDNGPFGRDQRISGSTLHYVVAELSGLGAIAASHDLPRLIEPAPFIASGRPDNVAGVGSGVPVRLPIEDVALAATQLRHRLENPFTDGPGLHVLLKSLIESGKLYASFDLSAAKDAPLAVLVPKIAAIGLIDFAFATRDLWDFPTGSPELFHYAARLDSTGLGPYISNIGQVVRKSQDVFDLAVYARRLSPIAVAPDDSVLAWVVLLSRGCRRELLLEIIDDLGDCDARNALSDILARVVSRPERAIDRELIMRLRDAGLDNADYAFAARAQQVLVRLSPDSVTEGVVLGEIEASGGAFGRAETILSYWLARMPDDAGVRDRLNAVKARCFDRFVVTAGFGSPAARRETRIHRRGLHPQYARRSGERMRAVDLG